MLSGVFLTIQPQNVNSSSNLIITGSKDFTIKVWRLPNLEVDPSYIPSSQSEFDNNIRTLYPYNHSVHALAGVGNIFISHARKAYSFALDVNHKRCMSGNSDGTVKIWSIENVVTPASHYSLRVWNPDNGT
ncbi:15878_t:CDS:2 [Entrophospora sp. SA101]|nr:15878_t:CDS:2 [Entrophospora sp. SA101]